MVRQCRASTRGRSLSGCATGNQVIGTVGGNGKVHFDAAGIEILVGRAFPRGTARLCTYGGNCLIQLSDLDNPSIVLSVPVTLAPKPSAERGVGHPVG